MDLFVGLFGDPCLLFIVPVVAMYIFTSRPAVVYSARPRTAPSMSIQQLLSAIFAVFLDTGGLNPSNQPDVAGRCNHFLPSFCCRIEVSTILTSLGQSVIRLQYVSLFPSFWMRCFAWSIVLRGWSSICLAGLAS